MSGDHTTHYTVTHGKNFIWAVSSIPEMNFAVTGGAGFVGSHIVRRLVADGYGVTVIDDLSRGSISNLDDVRDRIDFVHASILQYDVLKAALDGVDGIFHDAALAYIPSSYGDEFRYRRVNVDGSENVFRICKEHDIKAVYASSSTIYGDGCGPPIREDHTRNPINPYGMTKLEAELVAERYARAGVRLVGLRYFNVVGLGRRREYTGVIPRFLERIIHGRPPIIHGDGLQLKDFVFIDDVVEANLAAMFDRVRDGFFNIGSGMPITVMDLALLMIGISGRVMNPEYSEPRQGDARMLIADITKAGRQLGWRPRIALEDGLRALLTRS